MGYSHEDFLRTLATLMGAEPYTVSGTHITIPRDGRRVEIALSEEGERRIGPTIRLPRTPVEIVFYGFPEDERKLFMKRFEMFFRRGGG
jgi:hypothetical protein